MIVNRLNLVLGLAAVFVAAPAIAAPHKAMPEPVYKVDSVTTSNDDGKVVVTAHGAVSTGGWTNPQLRPKGSRNGSKDAHVMAYEFVAVPPPPDAAVIQALVPVEAQTTTPRPSRVSEIRVDAESDDAMAKLPDENADE